MKAILQLKQFVILFTLAIFCFYGCSNDGVLTNDQPVDATANIVSARNHGKVIHHVNVGTNDLCEAYGLPRGCDGNASLVANLYEDGFVRGQWQDTFFGGGEGVHVTIDCIQFGETGDVKWAIISGIITRGTYFGEDKSGLRAYVFVGDSGRTNQNDYMSFSWVPEEDFNCNTMTPADFYISPVGPGETVVW